MNREWYKIDVKQEVLNDIKKYLVCNSNISIIIDDLKQVSVRDMMDVSFVANIEGIEDPLAFSKYVSERYIYHRSEKYGQVGFWEAASNERNIGYNGEWYEYITNMLMRYCSQGGSVLFVGTADGKEIPSNKEFNYYALEQIGNSVKRIDTKKVIACYQADFEDATFVINGGKTMEAIIALRCLMPNTRINHFFDFVENNISDNGILIVSHPIGYLDENNEYKELPNCQITRKEFDQRLNDEIIKRDNMKIILEEETNVEYFYIIKVECRNESIID